MYYSSYTDHLSIIHANVVPDSLENALALVLTQLRHCDLISIFQLEHLFLSILFCFRKELGLLQKLLQDFQKTIF